MFVVSLQLHIKTLCLDERNRRNVNKYNETSQWKKNSRLLVLRHLLAPLEGASSSKVPHLWHALLMQL